MSKNYDNWERLVAAVIKREEIWELCHQPSRSPSICSEASSSDFSSSFRLSDDVMLENNEESSQKPVLKLVPVEGVLRRTRQLGKGRFGTSILTQLQRDVQVSDQEFLGQGTQLVMKKLRSKVLKMTEEEFKIVFGNCRHQNVAVPRAYYFSNNGNFVFNDYHSQGSVYDLLHGKSDDLSNWESHLKIAIGAPLCDWESRLKIAIGAAQGIAYIHSQCGGKLAHGNIKSSNIFVNSEQYGCVSDFGLAGIHVEEYMLKNPSHESDVRSFGVVLLELLTGKLPMEPQGGFRKNVNIVKRALSMGPQDWSSKLFDQTLVGTSFSTGGLPLCDELDMFNFERELELKKKIKVQMVEILQVARRCLATLPQDRPTIFEVVLNLNNICNIPRSRITTKLNCCLLRHY